VSLPDDAPGDDPLVVFDEWQTLARTTGPDADVLALATATSGGRPSVRYVLLRGITVEGLRFYTNYESRKGRELADNPVAAAAWFDTVARRQVRVEGVVRHLAAELSDDYFAHRDRGHQLGAVASAQSSELADRATLEAAYLAADARYEDRAVERPEHWGGYLLHADVVELWIQRDDRLHDRFSYTREDGAWSAVRLSP
jgi:pyridoxamine 5'-phosphate oxidase